ncbi:hypothetical protein BGX27_007044 [Mortierella sp. AM989]|nr:hypothetical protein BGX27_007044 [Mortierella sp. AM989]
MATGTSIDSADEMFPNRFDSPTLANFISATPPSLFSSTPPPLVSSQSPPVDSMLLPRSYFSDVAPELAWFPGDGEYRVETQRTDLSVDSLHHLDLAGDISSGTRTEGSLSSPHPPVPTNDGAIAKPYPLRSAIPDEISVPVGRVSSLGKFNTSKAKLTTFLNLAMVGMPTWEHVPSMHTAIETGNFSFNGVEPENSMAQTALHGAAFRDPVYSWHLIESQPRSPQTLPTLAEQNHQCLIQPRSTIHASSDFYSKFWSDWGYDDPQPPHHSVYASQQRNHSPQCQQQPGYGLLSTLSNNTNIDLCNKRRCDYFSSPSLAQNISGHYAPYPAISTQLKRRRRLTPEESEFLLEQFMINERPTIQERESIAKHLKLDRRTIQVWFQNRRAKLKRDNRDAGDETSCEGYGHKQYEAQDLDNDMVLLGVEDEADSGDGA